MVAACPGLRYSSVSLRYYSDHYECFCLDNLVIIGFGPCGVLSGEYLK